MTRARRERRGPIDWSEARERLARAIAATGEAMRLPPERARAVMVERARALARSPAAAPSAGEVLEVLRFALANERYALETRHVLEVARFADFTPVPGAPEFVLGVTSLRGEVLAVIDLRKFFGVQVRGLSDLSRAIVLGHEKAELAVLADETHEVAALRLEEVLEPPGSVAGIGREYLRGVTKDALIVLDGDALLGDPRLFIDQGADSRA